MRDPKADFDHYCSLLKDELPHLTFIKDIGRGGQGLVIWAADEKDNFFAIKVLLSGTRFSGSNRARFEREVELLSGLQSDHIVPITSFGTAGDLPYFIMPYIEGIAINDRCMFREPQECVELFVQSCDALSYAHAHGVIHRDIKPSNILVSGEGHVSLLDFGIARALKEDTSITSSSQMVGTPEFMSPEQIRGQTPLDVRVDIYGLGMTMFLSLSGDLPYDLRGDRESIYHTILTVEPARLRLQDGELDLELGSIVEKCLRKQPEDRYRSMDELCDDLKRWQRGEAVSARADNRLYRWKKAARRHKWGVAMALAVAAMAGFSTFMWQRAEHATHIARTELHAGGLINLGSAERDAGRIEDALEMWRQAASLCGSLSEQSQSISVLEFKSLHRLAELEYTENLISDAELHSTQAITIAESLFDQDPTDDKMARLLGGAYKLRGRMAFAAEDWEGAYKAYLRTLAIRKQLVSDHGKEASLKAELAKAYAALGRTCRRLDLDTDAHEYYLSEYEVYAGLAAKHPEVADYPIGLAFACTHLSSWYINQSSVEADEGAARYLQEAEDHVATVLANDESRIWDAGRIRKVIFQHSEILAGRHKGG